MLIFLEAAMNRTAVTEYFSKTEIALWCCSAGLILLSFCLFDRENYLTLLASLIGVTSLIFNAKGNPFGQFLMILFSLLYGLISWSFAYYGCYLDSILGWLLSHLLSAKMPPANCFTGLGSFMFY